MDFAIISAALKNGWDAFKNNAVAFIVGLLITIVGSIFIIPMAPLFYGLYSMAVKGASGEKVSIGDIFIGFKSVSAFIRSWIYWIIYIIIIIIISIISSILGSIHWVLAIIASLLSIIWGLVAFFSIYIYVSSDVGAISAFKESFNVLKNNLLMTILTYIVYAVLCIIGFILLGIGIFITFPIAMVFTATVLKTLKA
ncbi:MAG: hypothetical protein FWE54_01415 [Methanimicrococcus sp.]|nr:hypothetical protein [Methanimicrococcus sp.]